MQLIFVRGHGQIRAQILTGRTETEQTRRLYDAGARGGPGAVWGRYSSHEAPAAAPGEERGCQVAAVDRNHGRIRAPNSHRSSETEQTRRLYDAGERERGVALGPYGDGTR